MPPANGILTRGAGAATELDSVVHAHGLSASVVSGCNTVRGLGRMLAYHVVQDARVTGSTATDLEAKVAATLRALHNSDIVFTHVKAPDICAHDREPIAKRDFLERLDAALAPLAGQPSVIALAADHTTDSNTGFHTADPVPALLHVPGRGDRHKAVKFGESACREGNLPRQVSYNFLLEFIRATGAGRPAP